MLIVNADDLGRDGVATDQALACHARHRITSTSAMVFMADSARAAGLARTSGIEVGLHLNFSEAFTADDVPADLRMCHGRVRRFLKRSKYSLLLYRPSLRGDFARLFDAQYREFRRLYGRDPSHLDGHQHLHLASNVLLQRLLPAGAKVRRSFSFAPGEKSFVNRWYRAAVDRCLARRHRIADYFFSLDHYLSLDRLEQVLSLAAAANVELMTHPALPREYDLLLSEWYGYALSGIHLGGYDALS